MTVRELYDGRFEVIRATKWREQLLDRDEHMRNTATDVAEMILALEDGQLAEMLAWSIGDLTVCYVAKESGVWFLVNAKDHHQIYTAMKVLTERIDRMAIRETRELVRRLRHQQNQNASSDSERALIEAEEHLRELVLLYERIRTPSFSAGVVKRIITDRVAQTEEDDISHDVLDAHFGCIAFRDGIFSFPDDRLLTGSKAKKMYQTLTVDYSFEKMMETLGGGDVEFELPERDAVEATPVWRAYDAFVAKIFSSTPSVRTYLFDLLASSALNENRQVIVFHHNVKGSNGKTAFFALVRQAFGSLFVKCKSSLLSAASECSNPSGPNEEHISTRSKRIVLFSEPAITTKLSASFIKELTGGDEQSTRGMHSKKQTFVFNGTVHVLCNKIPELDDMEGGVRRRVRCIPYGSTFVDRVDREDRADREDPADREVCDGVPADAEADADADHDPDADAEAERCDEGVGGQSQDLDGQHVYLKETAAFMLANYPKWKHCLMWEVMMAARLRILAERSGKPLVDKPPDVVLASTKELIERDSKVGDFINECMAKDKDKRVSLKDAFDAYRDYCVENNTPATMKKHFKAAMFDEIGVFAPKSNGLANFWKGWTLVHRDCTLPVDPFSEF